MINSKPSIKPSSKALVPPFYPRIASAKSHERRQKLLAFFFRRQNAKQGVTGRSSETQ